MTRPPFLIPELLLLILSVPLALGKVPRNRFYGVRTPKTLSDDARWHASNKLGGRLLIASSMIYLGVAALVPYSSDSASLNWWLHMTGFVLPVAITIFKLRSYVK